ncbi:hypothetical protein ACFQ1E_09895 [Sphingomonas canadensis]|uniref:Uncharacterized protein n=1 Tax=Sphingomonas canadensis TaxID=1219257 RepID=A0ABW3H887_9SPHN|nr:hypothetical protein [Sphingomonas canadensis]MCW3836569.1 hypothetical protein [Sphingomonas canadensis]
MRRWAVLSAALLLAPNMAGAQSAGGWGEVVLENSTTIGAELYVNEVYQCTAPPRSSCTAEVGSGPHYATILFDNGDYILTPFFEVPEGMAMTLPVRDLMG